MNKTTHCLATFTLCFSATIAISGERPNYVKEELTREEAYELGIVITEESIEWLDVEGRAGVEGATVSAVRYTMNLPMLLNGQHVGGGDFEIESSCPILSQASDIETEQDYSAYTRFNMEHVVTADCRGKGSYWADFGSRPARIFWMKLEVD